jgi:hypothetical protein
MTSPRTPKQGTPKRGSVISKDGQIVPINTYLEYSPVGSNSASNAGSLTVSPATQPHTPLQVFAYSPGGLGESPRLAAADQKDRPSCPQTPETPSPVHAEEQKDEVQTDEVSVMSTDLVRKLLTAKIHSNFDEPEIVECRFDVMNKWLEKVRFPIGLRDLVIGYVGEDDYAVEPELEFEDAYTLCLETLAQMNMDLKVIIFAYLGFKVPALTDNDMKTAFIGQEQQFLHAIKKLIKAEIKKYSEWKDNSAVSYYDQSIFSKKDLDINFLNRMYQTMLAWPKNSILEVIDHLIMGFIVLQKYSETTHNLNLNNVFLLYITGMKIGDSIEDDVPWDYDFATLAEIQIENLVNLERELLNALQYEFQFISQNYLQTLRTISAEVRKDSTLQNKQGFGRFFQKLECVCEYETMEREANQKKSAEQIQEVTRLVKTRLQPGAI